MRWVLRALFAAGVAAAVYLMARTGFDSIWRLLAAAGWRLLLLVPLHAVPLWLDVAGWHALIVPRNRMRTLFAIATVREAVNRLLPVANIGGELLGIGLLAQHGTEAATAAASVVVETLLTLVAQFLFVGLGALSLLGLAKAGGLAADIAITLAISVPLIAGLFLALRYGSIFERLEKLARRIGGRMLTPGNFQGAPLDRAIHGIFGMRRSMGKALGWQFGGLLMGCAETWLALRWLGHPVEPVTALVLESLTQAVRHFIFFVPAGVGVQEAGLLLLGQVLGLEADVVIALSVAKRMREVLFGLPALIAWQVCRARRPRR
jgi:putative membrane protein